MGISNTPPPRFRLDSANKAASRSRRHIDDIFKARSIKAGDSSPPTPPFNPPTLRFDILPAIPEDAVPDYAPANNIPFDNTGVTYTIKKQGWEEPGERPVEVLGTLPLNYKTTYYEAYDYLHRQLFSCLHLFAPDAADVPTPGPPTMSLDYHFTVTEITEATWADAKMALGKRQAWVSLTFPVIKVEKEKSKEDFVSVEAMVQKGREFLVCSAGRKVRDCRSAIRGVELALESKARRRRERRVKRKALEEMEIPWVVHHHGKVAMGRMSRLAAVDGFSY